MSYENVQQNVQDNGMLFFLFINMNDKPLNRYWTTGTIMITTVEMTITTVDNDNDIR